MAARDAVSEVMEAFDGFKRVYDERHEKLQEQVDNVEKVMQRPNLGGTVTPSSDAHDLWQGEGDKLYPILRKNSNFAAAYRSAAGPQVSLADFVRGVANMRCTDAARASLEVGTDSSGGYAVPTVLMGSILQALVPASSLLQAGAGIADVSDGAGKQFNTAAIATIPTAAWRAEGGNVAESEPTFRLVPAQPRSLSFYFKVSRELLADALNLEPALRTVIAQAFAKEIDRAGLRGSGTAPEPRGILNTSGIQSVANGAAGASLATTAYANFVSALQALLAADAPMPTGAIMAPRSYTTLAGLLDTTNQPRRAPPVIERIPFFTSSQIPTNLTVGASVDCSEIFLGDFSKVILVMRERPSIQLARETFALTGEVAFVCHVRADIAVQYPAALAVITGVRA